jgi:hypothetical protein
VSEALIEDFPSSLPMSIGAALVALLCGLMCGQGRKPVVLNHVRIGHKESIIIGVHPLRSPSLQLFHMV